MAQRIFGTDGIRAVAGEIPLTKEWVFGIGVHAGEVLLSKGGPSKRFLIGKDTRESCGWIESALCSGLSKAGLEVCSAGVIPTSAVSAILRMEDFLGGSVISASHNPAEFNGIKFFSADGKKIPDAWEREIEDRLSGDDLENPKTGSGSMPRPFSEAVFKYVQFLKGTLRPSTNFRGLKWALDCANGSASAIAPELFRSLGADVKVLHHEPNGGNINLHCGALHPESLQDAVLKFSASGGCAFDGDSDRVQFVDEKGRLMDGDVLLAMAAKHLKKKGELKGDTVVATVMANLGFHKEMESEKIKVLTTPVGDRAVSLALESVGGALGGEQSGHIIFNRYLPTGDGILTALQILQIFLESGKNLSSFTDSLPKFPQVLLNLKVKEKIPVEKCPALQDAIVQAESFLKGSGRILVRYSGTEPLLRIMVEGNSLPKIKKIADDLAAAARMNLRVL